MSFTGIKRILFGEPFPTSREVHERVDNIRGLAIFASDPISSNAYATEAIISILIVLGSQAISLTMPIALGIGLLVLIVSFSYAQTIIHYPDGGGAYTVAKDNIGTRPSLIAAGALLTDYVLTVSVSVSAGIRAITSAFPGLYDYRVFLAVGAVLLITWINLRGIRESGAVFAVPTYAFIIGVFLVIIIGLVRYFGIFGATPLAPETAVILPQADTFTSFGYTWILLRAFAAGCTALTGIEAISNGIKAFKPPESKNAAKTMVAMAAIAMTLFIGISFLSTHLNILPNHTDSVLSQMTKYITGNGFIYYWVQAFTMLILILAANTGFQDFPRLSSYLANDGFLPRWMTNRGDRLVYNSGIITLAVIASIIIIVFQADEIAMLPLYAIGVMVSFTLSQFGMQKLMGRIGKLKPGETLTTKATTVHYEKGWQWKRAVNLLGSLTTFIVLIVIVATKFRDGAWIVVLTVIGLLWMFYSIRMHYDKVAKALTTQDLDLENLASIADMVVVPIADIHKGSLIALQYALRISKHVRAISIVTNPDATKRLLRRWKQFKAVTSKIELVILDYDYRDILTPLVDYIVEVNEVEFPEAFMTVLIPEFIPYSVGEQLLHNHTANLLRGRLKAHKNIIIIDVPYHIE